MLNVGKSKGDVSKIRVFKKSFLFSGKTNHMKHYFNILLCATLFVACSEQAEETTDNAVQENQTETVQTEPDEMDHEESNTADSEEMTPTQEAEIESEEVPEEFDDIDWDAYEDEMTQDFSFVIILSTKSYDAAVKRANEAAEKLGYPVDLRGLHENKEIGLSLSRKVCEEEICGGGLDYPIYIPRSDWGNSKYVSVEYSDAFDGFTKGYYIVVVSSGAKGDTEVSEALKEAKQLYKDAYAKTCGVWMGCGC